MGTTELAATKRGKPRPAASSRAIDYGALARLRHELRKFQAFSEEAAKKAGLTPQQHQALLMIKGFSGEDPVSVGNLASLLVVRHHTAVELIDRLSKLGLLTRIVDGADGRRVLAKLTKRGETQLQKLSKIHFEELRAIGPTLTRILKPFQRS